MKAVFVDTSYWVALASPNDQWNTIAKQAKENLGSVFFHTTDTIIIEFLDSFSKYGEDIRRFAVFFVQRLLKDPNVKVHAQTRDSLLRGVDFYEQRPDKTYSLTDCISMNTMRALSISEILTSDHHFQQEGFIILMTS
jgi:uncharacterized protein